MDFSSYFIMYLWHLLYTSIFYRSSAINILICLYHAWSKVKLRYKLCVNTFYLG